MSKRRRTVANSSSDRYRKRFAGPYRFIMKRFTALIGLLLVLGGVAVTVLGAREVADTLARQGGTRATAFVTDRQISTTRARGVATKSYGIQYRFELGGTAYTAGDATGRTNLYVAIPKPTWDELSVGDPIDVTYAKVNPANNRPVEAAGSLGDSVAAIVMGLLLLGVGVLVLVAARRKPAPMPSVIPIGMEPPSTSAVSVLPADQVAMPGDKATRQAIDVTDPSSVVTGIRAGAAHLHGGATSDEGWVVRYESGNFVRRAWRGANESEEILTESKVTELLRGHGAGIVVLDTELFD